MRSIHDISNPNFTLDGFEIHNIFSDAELQNVIVDLHNRMMLQAYKIGLNDEFVTYEYGDTINLDDLDRLISSVHTKNKHSVDFAVQELRECPSFYSLVNKKFLEVCSELLKCPAALLKIHFDGVLINIPSNKQRLYRFHSEAHYYPYRKNFLNFWMPVIHNKTIDNGAMLIKHKGHQKKYDFNEYSGFDKVEGSQVTEDNFFYQLELPESQISEYETIVTDLNVGDGLFFNSNTPHSSVVNKSSLPSYALIARVYDYRQDLTLSDRTGIKLYSGGKAGYPGLRPVI